MDTLGRLRVAVTGVVVGLIVLLNVVNAVDDMAFGNRWTGCPAELYGALGLILGGLYAPEVLSRLRNGRGKDSSKGGEPA